MKYRLLFSVVIAFALTVALFACPDVAIFKSCDIVLWTRKGIYNSTVTTYLSPIFTFVCCFLLSLLLLSLIWKCMDPFTKIEKRKDLE